MLNYVFRGIGKSLIFKFKIGNYGRRKSTQKRGFDPDHGM